MKIRQRLKDKLHFTTYKKGLASLFGFKNNHHDKNFAQFGTTAIPFCWTL
jgi:hypothetical protein